MEASNSISIPHALGAGLLLGPTRGSYIVMDYIEMSGSVNQEDLGHQLALMHLAEPLEQEAKDGRKCKRKGIRREGLERNRTRLCVAKLENS